MRCLCTQLQRTDRSLASICQFGLMPVQKFQGPTLIDRTGEAATKNVKPRTLVLFNYDWDQVGFARNAQAYPFDEAGFDLFSFPSNARLAWFDLSRFVDRLVNQAARRGWTAVVSNHEQFGALAAALLAERMGWPGTPVVAVLACQHKLYARQVMAQVCPDANCGFAPLEAAYG